MSAFPKFINTDAGLLVLRVSTGALMLFHGVAKLIHGHDPIKGILAEKGLPGFFWFGVPLAEVIAPILLILGVFTRVSGLGVALVMVFSIFLVHLADVFTISQNGGLALELNFLFLFGGLSLFFTGGGKYALYKPKNEWLQ